MQDAGPPPGKVRIALNGEFSAQELEDILQSLAEARAGLEPAVPLQPPSMLSDADVLVQSDALFDIRRRIDGGLRIWLRSEGFGWMAFELDASKARSLRDYLSSEIKAPGPTH